MRPPGTTRRRRHAAARELAAKYDVEMSICREVYRAVHEGSTPTQAYRGLVRVAPGSEHDPG